MRVSLNEVQVMCRKAFEGMGFAAGDCEDAADLVGWLQLQGLDGVGTLAKALDYLQREAARDFVLRYEDSALLVLDANGQSVLRCAATAVEMAQAKAQRGGQAVLRIHHCHNRILLLGLLSRAAETGLDVQAHWRDARQRHRATFAASAAQLRLDSEANTCDGFEQSITVLFSRPAACPRQLASSVPISPQGFIVDEAVWQRLRQLAERILVESSETSRRHGAGGGSDAD
ncbi:DUF3726 domain-containing protein [Pseudomonas sp. GD03858]|uniref:DUF3726 domain-containing protein n=1 Tax=unclassified Pseudomonas TaxID=196821 RepID=UPI00244A2548|nr:MULTISPECIES: DUF3726 domain-containing protein [unclassified Pseudomonas]MDH0648634.1 DUF3726 domain-containing protein [Pseudomonas sp. GD03867]MDH0664135.1 DUF3726 domain-containing protein [Pseudomonas sp. GD03858]